MHLQSAITVKQNLEDVTQFFYEPSSLARWDRSVAEMVPVSAAANGSGARFDTIAPSGMTMHYEVMEMDPEKGVKIRLNTSKMFKKAIWHFEFARVPEGTRITCHVHFTLLPLYLFLYPVLLFNKGALLRDLRFFEDALNEYTAPKHG